MKKAVFVLLVLCMVTTCLPITAQADDATLGGTGITVYPIDDTQVEMEKEIIDITVKDGRTYVYCQFFFHNTGDEATLLVGFPTLPPPEDDLEDIDSLIAESEYEENVMRLFKFRTYIDGKRVPVSIKDGLKPEGNNVEALYFPKWYTWNMTIGKDERLKVVNTYYMENSHGETLEWTEYILRSGSTWKGLIGQMTVRMRFEGYDMSRVTFYEMPPSYLEKDGTIVWEAQNIEPKEDVRASFYSSYDDDPLDNPFDDSTAEYNLYDKMGTRMLRNFNIKHYNGTTWWSHRMIRKFGEKQSAEFYYFVGVSYYKCKRYEKALKMLDKVMADDEYYIPCTYYKALVYKRIGDYISFRECLEALAPQEKDPYDPNWEVYWMQVWAQSMLNDMQDAC